VPPHKFIGARCRYRAVNPAPKPPERRASCDLLDEVPRLKPGQISGEVEHVECMPVVRNELFYYSVMNLRLPFGLLQPPLKEF
jgi:hypothetical protein